MSAGNGEAAELETLPGSALLIIGETTYDAQNVAVEYGLVAAWRSLHRFGNFGSKELTLAWRKRQTDDTPDVFDNFQRVREVSSLGARI